MAKQNEPVADKKLVDGSEIALHSHPGGGGGGLVNKSGEVTTDGSGEGIVTFNTPYADTNYFITFGCLDPGNTPIVKVKSGTKATTGFTVISEDDLGKVLSTVTVMWATGPYANP
ncbi:unnamed protein product [marine sediment metagenome]|uniref:H-type lectin domain-containing protein n=1 Tax=marine sediment metagenome TaxID=412755 RepID=X1R6S6_9ZZZZ